MARGTGLLCGAALAATVWAGFGTGESAVKPGGALLVMTGSASEVREARYDLAASQEVFDGIWVEHMGDRVEKAAQGWPMPPQVDFERAEALFVFDGEVVNSNGFRVMDVIEEVDAVTVRVESISFQTASFDGADPGVKARPWALVLIPATEKTIFLEENVQGIIGGEPVWKQRAAFPGRIGVGRVVPGTQQREVND